MGPFGPDILPRFNLDRVQLWPYRNNIPENLVKLKDFLEKLKNSFTNVSFGDKDIEIGIYT